MFRYRPRTAIREILAWIIALVWILPFWIVVSGSFKTTTEILSGSPLAPPSSLDLSAYAAVISDRGRNDILLSMLNSILVTGGSVFALIMLGSVTGYVIARQGRRLTTTVYYLVLIAIILPAQLGAVPLYVGARSVGLAGSLWGMIILFTALLLPLAIFFYAGFFRGLGIEYEEAALIDGATPWQAFRMVVLPLMGPATGTVAIFTGLIVWKNFFFALIFLSGSKAQTLPVAMYNYVGALVSDWDKIFVVVILSMIPILALFVFAQKKFVQGFSGGIKG